MTRFLISISNSAVSAILMVALSWMLPPSAFGELTYARGVVLFGATSLFDWLSLSIIRYWVGETEGRENRRVTLEASMAGAVMLVPPLSFLAYALAPAQVSGPMLLAIAVHVAALGYVESRVAIARSTCDDRDLGMLILPRAAATLLFALGAVWAGAGAVGVVGALAAAQCAGVAYLVLARRPFHLRAGFPEPAQAARFLRFGGASVLADAALSGGALALATLAIGTHGASVYGAYALANELLTRTVGAAGFALELALLPLALTALVEQGREAGRTTLSTNIGFSIAVLAPMLLGFYLVAPAFARLALSPDQRDMFVQLSGWVALQCVFTAGRQFILNQPLFAAERTAPALWCVLAGVVASVAAGVVLVPTHGALGIAWAQTSGAGLTFALQALVVWRVFPAGPPWRSLARIGAACATMALVLWPLRQELHGVTGLAAMVALGAAAYGVALWALDFQGLRKQKGLRALKLRTQA
ncbi:hypothetical protein SLNSH_11720 [Alsobacter soli]|uniref:Uncharacterized protein n=1 Tax=Alsobacter soli TaxID=2109933 RepID=A0A2T1HSY5_9HYPH|nr:polysaccharide biosynthesis C-terminal domain-containing protein [Alsobacter soli]PSC04756.1 hypothetical protein SLNSH_11720 [Alsobacter soli]